MFSHFKTKENYLNLKSAALRLTDLELVNYVPMW